MKKQTQLKWLFVTVFLLFSFAKINAQNGSVTGKVVDENNFYLPGANVVLEALKKGAVTDFDGKFSIVSVPAGTYKLKVTYLGYEDSEVNVTIEVGQTADVIVQLSPKKLNLNEVELVGYGNGQSKALNAQKNNMNVTNVVSTDQIGKFPDANIGDAVKRIPGITMQVDQGEARNIIVRGLSPQLNSVTLNGSRIPSAEGDNRNVQMDLIPSDMIQTIGVNKTITPDMDGDALGGSVNLVTATAPQKFRLSSTLGSGVSFITDKRILNGSFLVGNRSKNKKFGWMASASINDTDFGSDNIEAEWDDKFEYNTGAIDGDGEPVLEEVAVNPYTKSFETRKYLVQRVRRSFALNFDYQFNSTNELYFKSMYNWRDDRENRYRTKYEILDGEDITLSDFTVTNGNLTSFPAEITRETKGGISNNRNKSRRLEDQRMQNYSLGGKHLLGTVKTDWMVSFAKASEERKNERYVGFQSEYNVFNDNTDTEFPRMYAVNPTDETNYGNFEYDEITEQYQYTEEKDINALVNFEVPADFFGNGTVKLGVKTRFKNKNRNNNFFEYDLEDTYPTMDLTGLKDYTNTDFLPGSQYQLGSYVSADWLGSLTLVNGEAVPDEFLRANFDVSENVWAGYVMTTQQITNKLGLMLGVRVENTSLEATGNRIEDEEELVGTITDKNSYTNVLPSVHFKYTPNDNAVIRFAVTNTLSRPNYVDLIPSLDVVTSDEEIYVGNPDLKPTTSTNFDLLGEYYFKSVGLISGGLFYKDISDFIYQFQTEIDADLYGAGTSGYRVYQPLNGDRASIFGVEVSFQRNLDFLPGFAKNFNVYLNYTYLTSDAKGIRNEDGEERDDLDLPNTSPNMFNGSLGYNHKYFNARLSANFSDAYIDEIGGNQFEDRYYDQQFFLDFNLGVTLSKNLRLYAELKNITDQPLRYYQSISKRTQQAEYYGRRLTFGIKYDLY
ncbi:TonB-dependent receptor [Flavobacterium sp. NRK F10]|uniref:TonB-dependent receptor n=1 Tax=Flavobacterium sp. NRK F10 TaxID=2954931 RepID=UPI0020909261|nr:TonB-dependent receptor [Flavobacterium sp. NRK F10]MCO6176157.1 TonB-dependent receptor [Flavobacterium sp. NRK F10]